MKSAIRRSMSGIDLCNLYRASTESHLQTAYHVSTRITQCRSPFISAGSKALVSIARFDIWMKPVVCLSRCGGPVCTRTAMSYGMVAECVYGSLHSSLSTADCVSRSSKCWPWHSNVGFACGKGVIAERVPSCLRVFVCVCAPSPWPLIEAC